MGQKLVKFQNQLWTYQTYYGTSSEALDIINSLILHINMWHGQEYEFPENLRNLQTNLHNFLTFSHRFSSGSHCFANRDFQDSFSSEIKVRSAPDFPFNLMQISVTLSYHITSFSGGGVGEPPPPPLHCTTSFVHKTHSWGNIGNSDYVMLWLTSRIEHTHRQHQNK